MSQLESSTELEEGERRGVLGESAARLIGRLRQPVRELRA
jgi:hypothetical protein